MNNNENIRFQALKHEIVQYHNFKSIEEYVLYLIHRKPYEFISSVSAGKDILDYGCNNGYGTNIISENCKNIIGVDVSEKAVNDARKRLYKKNASFLIINGNVLPFSNNYFDYVVCFQVIEHVNNPENLLREIRRVLKTGGQAIFTTPNAMIRLPDGGKPWNKFHVKEYSANDLRELLKKIFNDVSIKGLFAKPLIYEIEIARINKEILESSYKKKRKIVTAIKGIFRKVIKKYIFNWKHYKIKNNNEIMSVKSEYSTMDLYYSEENINESLDLFAICK